MSRNKKKANKMVKEKKEDENGVFLILLIIVEAMLVLLVLYYIVHVSVWTFLATSGFIEAKTHQKTNEIPTFYSFVYSFFFHSIKIQQHVNYKIVMNFYFLAKKTKYQENSKKSFSKQPLTFSNNVNKVKIKNIVGDIGEKVIATQSGKKENQLPPNQDNSIVG